MSAAGNFARASGHRLPASGLKAVTTAAALVLAACAHGSSSGAGDSSSGGPNSSGVAAVSEGEKVLATRPEIRPLGAFAAPVPRVHTLKNGLKVYIIEKAGDGMEALQLVVRRGSAREPAQLAGLTSLAMEALEAGSAGRSQAEMARALDAIGATVRAGASLDGAVVSGTAMVQRLGDLVPLFADVALRPNFDPKEWSRLLGQRQAELIAEQAEPRSGAGKSFSKAIYGDHPYGRAADGTIESVKAMKLDDAKALFRAFQPGESALIAVGGAPEAAVLESLRKAFESWSGAATQASADPAPQVVPAPAAHPRLVILDYPGKPQTVVRVGQPAVPRSSPDVLALRVWNSVLGGSFTSRLSANLREKHGYTYGAGSGFSFGVGPGPFVAASDVKTEVTAEALKELLGEVERAVAAPITDAELQKGKSLLTFGLVEGLEHADGAAAIMGQLFLYGLPENELATFPERLAKLTVADVQAAAGRALDPAKMTIVLAGDARLIEAQLATSGLGLPAPQRRDARGDVISARK